MSILPVFQDAILLALASLSVPGLTLGGQSALPIRTPLYRIQDPTREIDNVQQSWGLAINDSGRVIGNFRADDWKRSKAFVWQDGRIVAVGIPQPADPNSTPPTLPDVHRYVRATGINDAGVAVGDAVHLSFGIAHFGFFTSTPAAQEYPPLFISAAGMFRWWTHAVSNSDPMLVVGMGFFQVGNDFLKHAFVQPVSEATGPVGSVVEIPPFGDEHRRSSARAVNDGGWVVGWAENQDSYARAFAWDVVGQSMTDLGTLGGSSSEATGINDHGLIVGHAERADGRSHAFSYDGVMRDLGTLGGGASSAQGLNDAGQIVGWSWTASGDVHAFLYTEGVMVDLNDRVEQDSGWVLQYAQDINSSGEIVGWGRCAGETRAFVLTRSGLAER